MAGGKKTYKTISYLSPGRISSIREQAKTILELKPQTVLEIGIGNGLLKHMLKLNNIKYIGVDIDKELQPDIQTPIQHLNEKELADIVACFQVLEHIEYRELDKALTNLFAATKKWVFISIPHRSLYIAATIWLPLLGRKSTYIRIPWKIKPKTTEHKWELGLYGKKGKAITARKFRKYISTYGKLTKEWTNPEFPYHRFYLLQKMNKK